ncbi:MULTISPECIES: hypothetical protein [unclassified Mesorhizobium]|uniref:hypothetical protein n=1 Tax=unclassified Mesorhizobium TaxID=325217 RepID=UPI00112CF3FE|nr:MULTISPECIES: hypothetical protein [unclassified Mesorhizobium]TPI52967.1 hypothetical protein FJW11_15105 [Mesorhizobium sp. B3-1-1]TPJ70993.1 hypothetical protein FJ462_04910 [Mesorhizobium sp. B2-6-7]TPJ85822.1 hypothetical protein FJ422_12105 [Mesorhizobium sp. B2-6-3]TPJ99690.1 hypothetical protein FJ491_13745 [Mesorhizobium sp. B2-5-10]TPK07733.1 hypothetical protein FJ490_20130 [Mesorhizobium sp. B2-5-11]
MSDRSRDAPTMDAERFAVLAAAYGGDLRRWPQAERAAGSILAASDAGAAILRDAGKLDALLDSYRVEAPGKALHGGIVRAADGHLTQRWRQRLWWLGLGLAGIGLAGAVAGSALVIVATPEVQPDQYVLDANTTAFGDAGPDDTIEENL